MKNAGADLAGMPVVWPTTIERPDSAIPLVYLDLNHFIFLARAAAGDTKVPDGYPDLLRAATTAANEHQALFPLSSVHVFEISKITDPRQRDDVAQIMEQLSGFQYLLGRVQLAQHEIEAAMDHLTGSTTDIAPVPLVGSGVGWGFGRTIDFRIKDATGGDASEALKQRIGAARFEALMQDANLYKERKLLAGPSAEDLPKLKGTAYAPEVAHAGNESRADFERDLITRLNDDPKWRTGRLRDVIAARELTHEWLDHLTRATISRGSTFGGLLDGDRARQFSEAMPSNRVAISIKTRYHRNPQHPWTPNDIQDIDALSVAVPYCQAVFTDKAARNALVGAPELRVLDTFLPRRPRQLTEWLEALPPNA